MISTKFASQATRIVVAVGLLLVGLVPAFSGVASGESLSDLRARMDDLQGELNAATADIEALHAKEEETHTQVDQLEQRQKNLQKRKEGMMDQVIEAATILYKNGNTSTIEALFAADSFGELSNGIEMLSKVSEHDTAAFIAFSRLQKELNAVAAELSEKKKALAAQSELLKAKNDELLSKFDEVSAEYEDLKAQLAEEAEAAPTVASNSPSPTFQGDLACPVSGPVSFIDSWGYPRSGGRSHQGVDMMANYGQPVVAIKSGTVTYAGSGELSGNWIQLTGDDGNVYWHMHLQDIVVSSGHVSIGQQIGTVGDTGNATGTPHLHFEYHPGGGSAVNPYPIAAAACF
ncbi:MAG: peptidoglycan DD-metalloendopeptidase family protein [Actinobacteria bacterium]|nr:peptidoglycan DD-metalloendopeptidase family protein [Actinomycetota bacterium]